MTSDFVKSLFLDDHQKQLVLWKEYVILKKEALTSNPENIRDMCSKLHHNLTIHFDSEEVLYGKYWQKTKNLTSIIKLVREDHKRMIDILELLNDVNADEDILALLNEFDTILKNHIVVEETKLYPALDAILSDADKNEVISDLKVHCSGYDV